MKYKGFSWEKFRSVLNLRGFSERQFVQHVYGDKTRMGIAQYFRGNFGIDKLFTACEYLDCRAEDLLGIEGEATETQPTGHASGLTGDAALAAELAALRLLIQEKDARIADLQRTVSYLARLTPVGQDSDTAPAPSSTL